MVDTGSVYSHQVSRDNINFLCKCCKTVAMSYIDESEQ